MAQHTSRLGRGAVLLALVLGAACARATPTPTPGPTALPGPTAVPLPVPGDALSGDGQTERTALTAGDLLDGAETGLVDESAFALPPNAAPPTHRWEGTLILDGEALAGAVEMLRDDFGVAGLAPAQTLPDFELAFVQNGSHLIPVRQGLIATEHPVWNYIVGPGRAWDEAGDGGYTRAAVPLALGQHGINCVHNGTLTFLFNADHVSRARFQITQETCLYLKFNLWAQLAATYTPGVIANAGALATAHAEEVARRLPTKPIEALAADYPGANINPAEVTAGLTAEHITAYGLLYNGVNYSGGCQTRRGPYAFCESLRLPSYSVAKSAFAAVALMRLGQLYGVGVYDLLIRDYVPEAARAPGGWAGVTFGDALDMATGYYASAGDQVDESDPAYQQNFITEDDYARKLAAALRYPRQADPGTQWVYHTSDTFVLTQAMQAYLRTQAGATADLFNLVRDEVYIPAGLSAGALTTQRTGRLNDGAPIGGFGLYLTLDDTAKLAQLLNQDHGQIGGVQVLEPTLLAAALQQNPADRGLPTSGNDRYRASFWVGSSRVDLQACKLEYSIVSPK